jgi:hypothetical protein
VGLLKLSKPLDVVLEVEGPKEHAEKSSPLGNVLIKSSSEAKDVIFEVYQLTKL